MFVPWNFSSGCPHPLQWRESMRFPTTILEWIQNMKLKKITSKNKQKSIQPPHPPPPTQKKKQLYSLYFDFYQIQDGYTTHTNPSGCHLFRGGITPPFSWTPGTGCELGSTTAALWFQRKGVSFGGSSHLVTPNGGALVRESPHKMPWNIQISEL